MRTLESLIDDDEPAIKLVKSWLVRAENPYELLPPSPRREECLFQTQVTTRSPMGAMIYESGGLLVDQGWLRFLGSGHPSLPRDLPSWNQVKGDARFLLVADDVLGGFFALNGGELGPDPGNVYYLPYDGLEWEPLDIGYSQFLEWSLSAGLTKFYGKDRWKGWEEEVAQLGGDESFSFYPFLWTNEGSIATSRRAVVPVQEAFEVKMEFWRQLR
jgi:uncharacterized protein DUF2625